MFGYKIIKEVEIEYLKSDLENANRIIEAQALRIVELNDKIKDMEITIAELTASTKVKAKQPTEEKPVKKVRRKSTKKTTKKEE